MFNIGAGELLLILLVAFAVVGPNDLPKIARGFAKGIKFIKTNIQEAIKTLNIEDEIQSVMEANDTIRSTLAEANPVTLLEKEVNDVKNTVKDVAKDVNPVSDVKKEIDGLKVSLNNSAKETVSPVKDIKKEITNIKN